MLLSIRNEHDLGSRRTHLKPILSVLTEFKTFRQKSQHRESNIVYIFGVHLKDCQLRIVLSFQEIICPFTHVQFKAQKREKCDSEQDLKGLGHVTVNKPVISIVVHTCHCVLHRYWWMG